MGRTLDNLAIKGVDCIKIIPSKHKFDGTVFLALGIEDGGDEHSYKRLCEICKSLEINDMGIEPGKMTGRKIKQEREYKGMNPNPKYMDIPLRLEEDRYYNVLEIKYIFPEFGRKTLQKILF